MEISLVLGVMVGAVLGLTGAGGGILAVPALVAGMGLSMQQAAPVALIAVAGSAALGAGEGFKKGLVRYKAASLIALAGLPFTSVGLLAAQRLPERALQGIFAAMMVIVAARLLKKEHAEARLENKHARAHVDPHSGRFAWSWPTAVLFTAMGASTGFLTGLLGVGGGFVLVPMLRRFTDVGMHGIIATSLLVIALVGGSGIATALAHGVAMPVAIALPFTLATASGLLLGRLLVARISAQRVQRVFAVLLVQVALVMLTKALRGA